MNNYEKLSKMKEFNKIVLVKSSYSIKGYVCLNKGHLGYPEG